MILRGLRGRADDRHPGGVVDAERPPTALFWAGRPV